MQVDAGETLIDAIVIGRVDARGPAVAALQQTPGGRSGIALAAIALTTDQAKLTCIANDYDFSEIFARQVSALGRPGDVAIGISTSGNSPNVLKALETARDIGMITIGWTGGSGGKLTPLVDHLFVVPSTDVARIQETHITLGHVLCELVDEALLGKE